MPGFFRKLRKQLIQNYHRKNKPERSGRKVDNNDYLLNQIDEFREKAQQLQSLLNSKESKVNELQSIVSEKEGQAEELENLLKERQEEADELTMEFEKQIDTLVDKVNQKLDEVQQTIDKQLVDSREVNESQLKELKETVEAVNTALDSLKGELVEKIHSENVKCYRNIQDLIKEYDDKIQKLDFIDQNVKSVKGIGKFLIWVTVIDFVVLVAFILYSVGVFNLFL